MFDVVILTDSRYVTPKDSNQLIENVLLEDQLVFDALEKNGLRTTRKAWDDLNFDWTSAKYAIFRSTWDCFERFEEFSKWFEQTKDLTQFINSYDLVSWNIDKHYLNSLQQKGINVPKTLFVEPTSQINLGQAIEQAKRNLDFKSEKLVLKPCIAGGARHTYKFSTGELEKYETLFQELTAAETMMLQEFQKNIVEQGEISIVMFNGNYSHAILKVAKSGDFRVQDDFGGSIHEHQPSAAEIDFAKQVLLASPEMPIYARVDIFRDNDDNLALAELEIFEPELWFRRYPKAADHLAKSIRVKLFD